MIVNVHEAKTQFSRLVARAAAGEEIIIGKAGRPLARLVPYNVAPSERRQGRWAGKIRVADDFDSTPEWLVDAFEGS